MNDELGIYIHIPFCASKCFYCNFYSEACKETNIIEEYINTLCKEIMLNAEILSTRKITSVYFGGGTPSVIDSKYIEQIIEVLKLFNYVPDEVTIEVNPESATREKLETYFKSGINRLSIGMQSVNNETLKKIGRASCNIERVKEVIDIAGNIGFNNISLDCIIGLPDETLEDFKNTISFMLSFENKVKHISAYSLEVHEDTKINFLIKNGYLTLPDEDLERKEKHELDRILADSGYTRYEISNYAKDGMKSKHNLKYWNKEEYLGFGASAASYITSSRYTNISDIHKYIEGINNGISVIKDKEDLDEEADLREYIILKLRLIEGLDINEFNKKFKTDIMKLYGDKIKELINKGLLSLENNKLHLTYKGEDLANLVWEEFI